MAEVNKQSLREEYHTLDRPFEALCAKGKRAGESRDLFQALLMGFDLLMAVFMQKRTPKNSPPSSLLPSQTSPDDTTPQLDSCRSHHRSHPQPPLARKAIGRYPLQRGFRRVLMAPIGRGT